jgi:glucose/arabinose dehydrogenase/PKD repeat protein
MNQSKRHRRSIRATTLAMLMATGLLGGATPASNAAPAPGFEDTLVADVPSPTAVAFTPDGRLLVASQKGRLWVRPAEGEDLVLALDILDRVCWDRDQGMLGLALDPAFSANGYVYVSYTSDEAGDCGDDAVVRRVNRVSRFVMSGNTVDPSTEEILLDNLPAPDEGLHSNGDLAFDPSGYLYVSLGDGGCDFREDSGCQTANDAARDLSLPVGKVLRIRPDGSLPDDNPFTGPNVVRCNETGMTEPGNICAEIYAYGFRNPYRMAVDPASGKVLVNDVGYASWEEIDVAAPGGDFGWNQREAHCKNDIGGTTSVEDCGGHPPGMTDPIYQYSHDGGCAAITGGAFVPGGVWPASFDGRYLFADLTCSKIFELVPEEPGFHHELMTETVGLPVDLEFGAFGDTQALYYATRLPDQVRMISYVGNGNRRPTGNATASPSSGAAPLTVAFDGSSSSDPDGDELTYEWDFGDGSEHSELESPHHTYELPGTFVATLTVRDPSGATSTTTTRVDPGNDAPVTSIDTPGDGARYRLSEPLHLTGHAADPQDGSMPDSSLTWTVLLHHNAHTHVYLPPTSGNGVTVKAPGFDESSEVSHIHLEVRLTATDSRGVSSTASRDLFLVPGTEIISAPSGLVSSRTATLDFISKDFDATFECRLDGSQLDPCAPPYQVDDLSDGAHTFAVQATDSHGVVDAVPVTTSWKVDATPPRTTITAGPRDAVSSKGATFEFGATDANAVTFECSLDGSSWTTCSSPARFENLAEGGHTFGVRATDAAGNVEVRPAGRAWTVDTIPAGTFITEGPPSTSSSDDARLEFASDDSVAGYRCSLDGSAWAPCTSPRRYTDLADGTHVFEVAAIDPAGNVDESPAVHTWTIDTVAPGPPRVVAGEGKQFQTSTSFDVTWSGDGVSFDVEYLERAPGSADTNEGVLARDTPSRSATFEGDPGRELCFTARARDAAGNVSAWSAPSCTTLPLDDASLPGTTTGQPPSGWSRVEDPGYYLGSAISASRRGTRLRIGRAIPGSSLMALMERGPRYGRVVFYLRRDGRKIRLREASLEAPERATRALIPIASPAELGGGGTVVMEILSRRRPVVVDGVAVGIGG